MPANDGQPDGTITWRELRDEVEARLEPLPHVVAHDQEARWLVEEASGAEGAEHFAALYELATQRGVAKLDAMVARRVAGEPLQYVLGHWSFRSLDLLVDPRVLIPRPETETVVSLALAELDRLAHPAPTVVDLGTGSGAIALAVAVERPAASVWATDRSADALAVARANLAGIGRSGARVRLAEGHWFAALPADLAGSVALITSNPPYVAATDPLPPAVVDWEPTEALLAGPDGLDDVRTIVAEAPGWLAPGGALVVEIGEQQGAAVAELATAAGLADATIHPDLAGRPRALVARRPR